MRHRARLRNGLLAASLTLAVAGLWPAPAAAQPGPDMVAVEAMQCWRRIASHAVHVGERFDMVLTCAVVDTQTARVVPDLAWLEPETLGVSPFEVLDGERYDDVVRGPRRFFQYRYALRIIGEDYFGLDVELPALELRYRIERSIDGGTATEGRELAYVLPPESVRVLSLVPAAAVDIRELPGETFGDVEARLFRANLIGIAAMAIGVAAAGVLLLGAVRVRREWRGVAAVREDGVPAWRVARTALGELRAVRDATAAQGWTGDLVARALAALRIAAALALGRPVAQRAGVAVGRGTAVDPEGRLPVRRGLFGRETVFVCSALTARDIDGELPRVRVESAEGAPAIETLRVGLAGFAGARYGSVSEAPAGNPTPAVPATDLAAHLEAGIEVLQSLQVELFEPVRRASRLYRNWKQWAANRWRP
ncbi:MAG: hypothetical protein F4137_02600 [Acidobacteria bacterium]|nr:hypothetical protein [Acidobacteriota bacterium]MYH27747.1 hypothetical protein [Acidobacteriota bacterium]